MSKVSGGPKFSQIGPCTCLTYRGPEPDPHRPGEIRHSLVLQGPNNVWYAFYLPDAIFHEMGQIPTGAKTTISAMTSGFFREHTPLAEILPAGIEAYLEHYRAINGLPTPEPTTSLPPPEAQAGSRFWLRLSEAD